MKAPSHSPRSGPIIERSVARSERMMSQSPTVSGQPLSASVRAFFEPRFGHDFSQVRVYTDERAAESAAAENALAYTVGDHITFAAGRYAPGTQSGRQLLGHELAHVCRDRIDPTQVGMIQRYEGPEHRDLGDRHLQELYEFLQTPEGAGWAIQAGQDPARLVDDLRADRFRQGGKIRLRANLELTPGEIIALMGDFYGTWRALLNAPTTEVRRILDIMDREERGAITPAEANTQYELATERRYTRLAKANTSHFAPHNRETWLALHTEALALATQAGRGQDEEAYQQALLIDAAGGHFLTDAFAAGHLFDVDALLVAIQQHLRANPPRAENPELQTLIGGVDMAGLAPLLVLKNIHDRLNREGYEVSNAKDMRWRTFGDQNLNRSAETQRIAALAVFTSRQQIVRARNGEKPLSSEVLELLPDIAAQESATQWAIALIPDAVRELPGLLYRQRSILRTVPIPILPQIGESLIGTIADPGRPAQLLQLEAQSRELGLGPLLAPQFTIGRF